MNRIRSVWLWGRDLGRTKLLVIGVAAILGLGVGAGFAVARWGTSGAGIALCQAVRGAATDAPSRYKAKEMSARQRLKWGIRLSAQLKQKVVFDAVGDHCDPAHSQRNGGGGNSPELRVVDGGNGYDYDRPHLPVVRVLSQP